MLRCDIVQHTDLHNLTIITRNKYTHWYLLQAYTIILNRNEAYSDEGCCTLQDSVAQTLQWVGVIALLLQCIVRIGALPLGSEAHLEEPACCWVRKRDRCRTCWARL